MMKGSIKLDTWDDQQTGAKRSKHKIVAFDVQFGAKPKEQEGQGAPQRAYGGRPPARAGANGPGINPRVASPYQGQGGY